MEKGDTSPNVDQPDGNHSVGSSKSSFGSLLETLHLDVKISKRFRNMEDLSNQIPRDLKCPICFLLPEGKVLQCIEGHTICEVCYGKLEHPKCPQCSIPYGDTEIRNRTLENLIDKLELECKFKNLGCPAILDRTTICEHVENCKFAINLCKLAGYSDCTFRINGGNLHESVEHLRNVHGCFTPSVKAITDRCDCWNLNNPFGIARFRPNVMNLVEEFHCLIIIFGFYFNAEKSFSWIPIIVPDHEHWRVGSPAAASEFASKFEVKFTLFDVMESDPGMGETLLKFKVTPIDIGMAERFLHGAVPFRIPSTVFGQSCIQEGNKHFRITMEARKIEEE